MAVTKKRPFERWVARSLRRRHQRQANERRRFDRERFLRDWAEWLLMPVTRRALVPMSALMVVAAAGGWWFGSQQFCRQQIVQPGIDLSAPPAPSLPLP